MSVLALCSLVEEITFAVAHLGFLFDPAKHVPMAPSFVYL